MAGGPTALTLIARTSATGAQPLSLRARFPRPRPPMKKIPLAAADPDRLDTWVKYREGLCGECNATCCTLPVEVRIDDLIRMRLVDEFEREEPAKRIAKRLEKDGVIEHFNHKREIFTLTRMANGNCLYLDRKTRLCTIYARRPDTCRNHPRIGPRPGHCAYRPK
ncbi:YkgJ family cysteine cluster protein [Pseudomonas aeruginosa]